jgi:hypothetical protein
LPRLPSAEKLQSPVHNARSKTVRSSARCLNALLREVDRDVQPDNCASFVGHPLSYVLWQIGDDRPSVDALERSAQFHGNGLRPAVS